ncbi:hypothetical protein [Bacteroides sp. 51]|uniref:hypothetical protein n=1 Tax=Bacteroides sp. 51 TaxID=2302938 RepID=UPI0013D7BAB7|nr:hypothetical protein [Bacteroides sp. 51]NDV83007.1 hypothetical protein [Bacteroides sp. 51]
MQKEKIDDLEIDLKELKFLLEKISKEPIFARSAMRLIDLMKERLDEIKSELEQPVVKLESALAEENTEYIPKEESVVLEETIVITPEIIEIKVEPQTEDDASDNNVTSAIVLGEQLRPALELSKGLSLNDTFRFSRELFGDDKDKMNKILQEISTMNSLAEVLSYLSTQIKWDEENDATKDFIELLKKYFV